MMKLNELQPNFGSTSKRKRVGRGISGGQGKTCGKGTKGQNSRSGEGGHQYRQGGNLPFYRRLPFMRGEGFTPPSRTRYTEINLDKLAMFPAGTEVTPLMLAEAGLLDNLTDLVKILGRGELGIALKLTVHKVSKSARAKIEAVGGSIELIGE
jgi:large subunit ribosomal protein L15